ncbi:MAG: hypothetical protein RIF41_11940 [Polyangiaceae bacterium]
MHGRPGLLLFALISAACGGDPEGGEPLDVPRPKVRTCLPPEGFDGTPSTTQELVELINALPRPVTVPCLLETFDRPLELSATSNTFSLQPAFGPNNPRLFIFREELIVSVVTKGEGRPLVELGEMRSETRTVKAEIEFPVTEELSPAAPYDRIREEQPELNGTKCGFCHIGESLDDEIDITEAYVSDLVSPPPSTLVDLDYLLWAYEECDPAQEPDRCAMFDSIFAHGEVQHRPLP